jgi:hypothetical protein
MKDIKKKIFLKILEILQNNLTSFLSFLNLLYQHQKLVLDYKILVSTP